MLLADERRQGGTPFPPYLAMMKLGTVTLYIKEIQKIYQSRDTSLLTSALFHWNSVPFAISRNTDIAIQDKI